MQKRHIGFGLIIIGVFICGYALGQLVGQSTDEWLSPLGKTSLADIITSTSHNHLSFESLSVYVPQASQIRVDSELSDSNLYTSQVISYISEGKKVTGQLNRPKTPMPHGGYPAVIMLRGYVNPEIYQTGIGTRNAAAVYAQNGFVTIAPDFLGFGGSDNPDSDPIVARLTRPITVLNLIGSIQSLDFVNPDQLFMWGHSNGGQIALSILQVTGKDIPTTLWAPVSKGFPYSILYYTDDYSDGGRALRSVLSQFEANHNAMEFSIDQHWDWINAPILVHQGGNDSAIPQEWSDQLVNTLESLEKEVTYFTYPTADHNLRPDWDTVVQRDLQFFQSFLE